MDQNTDNQTPQTPPEPESTVSQKQIPQTPSAMRNEDIPKEARQWGMFCHLAALAMFTSIPFANIIGPLILWLIKKEDFAFVDDQGKEALNFQISVVIYALVSSVTLCFPPLFGMILIGLMIANLIFIIIASIESNKGTAYRYPCCIRLVK
jgi:uncharacterized Tic20 family protein